MLLALLLALDVTVVSTHSAATHWALREEGHAQAALPGLDAEPVLNLAVTGSNDTAEDLPTDDAGDAADQPECKEKVVLKVKITILGKLGPLDAEPSPEEKKEKKEKASKWIFSTLLRSMLRAGSNFKLSKTAVPTINVTTKEPFSETEDGQRSPLERTIVDIDFPDTDTCSAAAMGKFVCRDYDGDNEELITGFVRSLDVAEQYPAAAMEMASKAGLSTKSLITLRAAADDSVKEKSFCNWGRKFAAGSVQGALMLPDCPANSVRCEDRPHLCTSGEPLWSCKCTLGYSGTVTIPGLEATVPEGPFHVEGECKAIPGYCELSGKYVLKLSSGEDAQGVLGETATPSCPQGFEASGSSECAESQSSKGMWSPTPQCNYLPSKTPPKPFCQAPQHDSLKLKGCRFCMGVEKGKKGAECDCEVTCDAGYKEFRGGEPAREGKKECIANEFKCPTASMNGTQCIDSDTQQPTQLFCCDESWGANVPPSTLEPRVCSEIKEDKECLTSSQSAVGVDGDKAGEACCWSRSARKCSVKSKEGQSPCAVAKRVLVAEFTDLPRCVPPCENSYESSLHLENRDCDRCWPTGVQGGECSCEVECRSELVRIGGGPEGKRSCEPVGDSFAFGSVPPACWYRPQALTCPSVDAPGRDVKGCNCKVSDEHCKCEVSCSEGFVHTGEEIAETRCDEKPMQPQVTKCEAITNATECLLRHATADPLTPCCWREDGFRDGVHCLPAGDASIRQTAVPDSCAPVSFAEWTGLPTCTPLCTLDLMREARHIVIDPACENCVAGQADCGCTVTCEPGYEYVGGGKEGARSCLEPELSLGLAPVCRKPQAAFANSAGEPGRLPVCPNPPVGNASYDCECKASPEGCSCPIFCKYGFGNAKADAPEGLKNCTIEEKVLEEAKCNDFRTEADCLSHAQDGEPCCFREQGLDRPCADGDCKVCAARYDANMTESPSACAKSLFATWEEMPDCQPLCKFAIDFFSVVETKGTVSYEGDCSSCLAGQPCNCDVSCADGYIRVGGGPEGRRSCTHADLTFEEFPLCQEREGPAKCPEIQSTNATRASQCDACDAADEKCECEVQCNHGYAQFTDIEEGSKKCHPDPDYALTPGSCEALISEEDCLKGSEDDVPCCWRGAGYGGGKKCAKRGSSLIELQTAPDACAATKGGKWDPLPECKQLCFNQFFTSENVEEEGCDKCFVGEPCPCTVKCAVNTLQRSGEKGPKSCGHIENDPASFGEPLVCEAKEPPKVPYCGNLPYSLSVKTRGCKKCKAGDEQCSCEATCRPGGIGMPGYKRTGGGAEGRKKCLSRVYQCPLRTRWDAERSLCKELYEEEVDKVKGNTLQFCCPEATGDVELDGSGECSSIMKESQCLKRKDSTTGEACCWRDDGFTDTQKCAAHGSSVITSEHRPDACANRPRILFGQYEEFPECTRRCENRYVASYKEQLLGGAKLVASGCDDCVENGKDCPCTVKCAEGLVRVGGGKEGPRTCEHYKWGGGEAFPEAPVCWKPPAQQTCDTPRGHGLSVQGCEDCTPGDLCHCQVYCHNGMAPTVAGSMGVKECQSKPNNLKETKYCSRIEWKDGREACLNAVDSEGRPCCWRRAGWHTHHLHSDYCLEQGSEEMTEPPDACAATEVAEFETMPVCKPACTMHHFGNRETYTTKGCMDCVADTPCDCKVQCATGYEWVGGTPENAEMGCTSQNVELPPPPVCIEKKEITCTQSNHMYKKRTASATLELRSCERCLADSSECKCSVTCAAQHILLPGTATTEGPKRCLAVEVPGGDRECESISDYLGCVEGVYEGKRCCWQEGHWNLLNGGRCFTEGSARLLSTDGWKLPQCAVLLEGEFEEFPECVPLCKHDFARWNSLTFDEEACTCPNMNEVDEKKRSGYDTDKDCKCHVSCAEGYHKIGKILEGPRTWCGRGWDAPVCMKDPPPRACPKPNAPGLKVTGCDCHLGQEDCSCHVDCLDGYSITAGQPGELICEAEDDSGHERTQGCTGHRGNCMALLGLDAEPCCWRSDGFYVNGGGKCQSQDSGVYRNDLLPEECGYTSKVFFRPLAQSPPLECTPICTNIFAEMSDVEHENCDGCKADEDCQCTAKCRSGLKALAGNTGPRRCLLNKVGHAEFEAAPVCVQPCQTPDHQQGTLDVSGCMNDCVPGDKACSCEVHCASGNYHVDGGREGAKACTASASGTPRHVNLPICLPKCVKPEDQFGQLNTNKCASCTAGKECSCELMCYTKSSENGARNGKKTCIFVPGDENSAAAAEWGPLDGEGPRGVPSCLPPMIIKVDDARTKQPLRGVTITIKVPYYKGSDTLKTIQTLHTDDSTNSDLSVEFSSEARDIFVTLEKEKYTTITRKLDRGKNCEDQKACEFHFALSEQLEGGQLYPDGCFIIGNPKTMEWDMRAVLEWDQTPADLDIWARSFDCYDDVERDYNCDGDKVYMDDGRKCMRRWFTRDLTREKESQVCGTRNCYTNQQRTVMKADGRPRCQANHPSRNQFNKWVFWNVRYATDLQKRWDRERMSKYTPPFHEWKGTPRDAENAKGWTDDNYIVLDIDEQNGRGPETISFKNVPPGTYQVVVNQWTNEGKLVRGREVKNVAFGNPRVNIYIGGNSVVFECEINEQCTKMSRLWNVVNIEVVDKGPLPGSKTGEHQYQIRLKDEESKMKKLRRVELPTTTKSERNMWGQVNTKWRSTDWMGQDYFFEATAGQAYTDEYLESVCYGVCTPADEAYKGCLARTEERRLFKNETRRSA